MEVSTAYPVQSAPQTPAVQGPAGEAQAAPVPAAAPMARFDEYEPETGEPSPGVYSVEPDGAGGRRVEFRPYSGDGAEQTTANTDRVDGELRQLKQRQATLEQKLSRAEEGGAEERELEQLRKQLEAVRSELTQKDNDAYRKGHAVFTDA